MEVGECCAVLGAGWGAEAASWAVSRRSAAQRERGGHARGEREGARCARVRGRGRRVEGDGKHTVWNARAGGDARNAALCGSLTSGGSSHHGRLWCRCGCGCGRGFGCGFGCGAGGGGGAGGGVGAAGRGGEGARRGGWRARGGRCPEPPFRLAISDSHSEGGFWLFCACMRRTRVACRDDECEGGSECGFGCVLCRFVSCFRVIKGKQKGRKRGEERLLVFNESRE